MGENDVQREQGRVGERECDPDRFACESHVGEDVDAGHCERQGETVAAPADADCREQDHGQELDRRDRAERQPVDREVEAAVHRGEDRGEADHQPPRLQVDRGQ